MRLNLFSINLFVAFITLLIIGMVTMSIGFIIGAFVVGFVVLMAYEMIKTELECLAYKNNNIKY